MGKLNEAAQVSTIGSEYVLLTDSNGLPVRISKNNLAEAIRSVMNEADIDNKGLMPAGLIGSKNTQASVLLCETTNTAITGSILLAISATTTGTPNLYFITIARSSNSTSNPTVKVKVLSGTYNIKIIGKTDESGKCRIYAERIEYTPVLKALVMNTLGIVLKMEAVTDNSEFANGFEAELI